MSSAAHIQGLQRCGDLFVRASSLLARVPYAKQIGHFQVERQLSPSLAAAHSAQTAQLTYPFPALGQMVRHAVILSLEAILRDPN